MRCSIARFAASARPKSAIEYARAGTVRVFPSFVARAPRFRTLIVGFARTHPYGAAQNFKWARSARDSTNCAGASRIRRTKSPASRMAFDGRSAPAGSAQAMHSRTDMNQSKHPVDPDLARALWLTGSTMASSSRTRPKTSYRRATPRQPVELYPRGGGRPLIFMSYAVGDYVVPSDLPRQSRGARHARARRRQHAAAGARAAPLEGPCRRRRASCAAAIRCVPRLKWK
jgi:hypothetical protein